MRVYERVLKGGHDVPDLDVRRRYDRSLENLPGAIQIADAAVLYDNSESTYNKMLEYQGQLITWRAEKLPDWLIKALTYLNP